MIVNIQTLFLIIACILTASLVAIIIILESKQSVRTHTIQYAILVIIALMILTSTFYLSVLPSFFGGGAIKEYSYEKVLQQQVVIPELKAKNIIKYKDEGIADLNNSLKNKIEVN